MTIYIFQSWNKYSPLPSPSGGAVSKSSSTSDFASPSEVDPYVKLSSECQGVINNLVSMGFSRPRVARAVENFGCDEKEVCIKKKVLTILTMSTGPSAQDQAVNFSVFISSPS
jgi:hypothetical protein